MKLKNLGKKNTYLTARQIATIKTMIERNLFSGGTKRIQYKITPLPDNIYTIDIFRYYSLASVSFDCRPEAKIPKWYFEQQTTIKIN